MSSSRDVIDKDYVVCVNDYLAFQSMVISLKIEYMRLIDIRRCSQLKGDEWYTYKYSIRKISIHLISSVISL